MSTDDEAGGQSLEVGDDIDEAKIPTAPMKAVPMSAAKPALGSPLPDFDDDDDDFDDEPRPGSKENPFTETPHPKITLDPEVAAQVDQMQSRRKPNMGMVVVRVLVLLGVIAAVGLGALKLLR